MLTNKNNIKIPSINGSAVVFTAGMFFSFVFNWLITLYLPKEEVGFFQYYISMITFAMVIVPLGYQSLAQREVNILNKKDLIRFSKQAVTTTLFCSVAFCVIWYFSVIEFELVKGLNNFESLLVACFLVPVFGLTTFFKAVLQGQNKIYNSIIPDVLLRPIFLIIGLGIMLYQLNSPNVISLLITLGIILTIILIYSVIKSFQNIEEGTSSFKNNWRKQALILLPIGLLYTINERVDVIMIAKFLGGEDTAIYSVAFKFASFTGFGIVILNQVMVPHYAQFFKQKLSASQLNGFIRTNIRKSFALSFTVFIILLFGGKLLLDFFGGDTNDYSAGYIPMLILAGGQIFNVSVGSVGYILTLGNHEKIVMLTVGGGIIINVILNITLLPIYGVIGAALASSFAMVFWNIVMLYFVRKKTGVKSSIFNL